MLPSLPEAAAIPWHVQRYVEGNISAGIMKVRVFAPGRVVNSPNATMERLGLTKVEQKMTNRN
jgi:hypothetical protein